MAEPRKSDFLVRVRRRGSPVRVLAVATPEQARRVVDRLVTRPEIDEVCWMPHPALGAPVRLLGRYRADIPGIGDTRRVAHLFLLVPGAPISAGQPMTARCGEPIRSDQLDIVAPGKAMPCYRCAARLPDRLQGTPPTTTDGPPNGIVTGRRVARPSGSDGAGVACRPRRTPISIAAAEPAPSMIDYGRLRWRDYLAYYLARWRGRRRRVRRDRDRGRVC